MVGQLDESRVWAVTQVLSPVIVAQNTSAEQSFTLSGLLATDIIDSVTKPTAQAGLGIVGCRAAAGAIKITFANFTGSGITPTAAETYTFVIRRPEHVYTALPLSS
jgi:hypothetical protein